MSCWQCQSSVLCFWHRRSPHDDYVHVLLPAHTLVSICKHAVVGLTVNEFLCRHSKAFLAMKTGLFSQADFDKMASIELEACELWGSQVPNSYSRHIIIHFHGVNCQINPVSPHVKLDFVLSCYIARLMNFCQAWQGRLWCTSCSQDGMAEPAGDTWWTELQPVDNADLALGTMLLWQLQSIKDHFREMDIVCL